MTQTGTDAPRALHYSAGKSGVDQLPPDVLMAVADVYTYGGKKYARNNWINGTDWHEFYGSALRHLLKWWNGEDTDACGPDCTVDVEKGICLQHSNLSHLAHAIWNIGTLLYFQAHGLGVDDRIARVLEGVAPKKARPDLKLRLPEYMRTENDREAERPFFDRSSSWSEAEVEQEERRIEHKNLNVWRTFNDGGKFDGRPIPNTGRRV